MPPSSGLALSFQSVRPLHEPRWITSSSFAAAGTTASANTAAVMSTIAVIFRIVDLPCRPYERSYGLDR